MGYGEMKYVFLDEADGLSPAAQGVLRGTMEKYASSVRFLLTCNHPNKITDAIKSRCETGRMHIESLDMSEFYMRLVNVLDTEKVEIDPDALQEIVQKTYPDLRRGISMIQANTQANKLISPNADSEQTSDALIEMVALFKSGKYRDARLHVCEKFNQEDYEGVYRFMYENLEVWADTEEKENKCILVIRDGIVKHGQVGDTELNLSATLVELEMVAKGVL
jgi:DNA polymerase III delta prime subunit